MQGPYRFGHAELRPVERELLIDGEPAPIKSRAFDLLLALVERRERMVTKDELLSLVWPGLVVEENNLHVHVSALRKLVGEQAIATIPGRGYRFALPVQASMDTESRSRPTPDSTTSTSFVQSRWPTGTVTFMFTDIEGSTSLWEEHPDAMQVSLAQHDRLLHQSIESNAGYVVKSTGDGVLAVFATAPNALAACLAAQRALQRQPADPSISLPVRMGLHTGTAELRDSDYYGSSLNRAARIMAAGHGGQILLSRATAELLRTQLPDGVTLLQIGEYCLKGLLRPEQLLQVVAADLRRDFPPLTLRSVQAAAELPNARTSEATKLRTNLPAALPALISRDDDLATLGTLVDENRLVTVVGAGGIGKTLLAQHLLASRQSRYTHGVCWVELATLSDPAGLPEMIAAGLGVRIGSGDDPLAALGSALAPLEVLLALDNAEHLLSDVAGVADALHRIAPGVRLLVTSQAPLKLAAEHVMRLGPLAVPDGPLLAQQALAFGAVALFTERARAADTRFALTDAAAPAVIELCRALDGMALAIELAAARAPTLGVQRLAASMHERLRLLTSSRNRTAPARQQTLRATLEWSHALLEERERAVFRRLAVVAGSASLELIQRVAACERWNEWDVLDALDVLVERSLVAVLAPDEGRAPRYRLLESPRAYAREQLEAAGELEHAQRAHALAVRDRLTASRDARDTGRVPWDASLDAERADTDNARDAFAWAHAAREPALAVEIGALLLRILPGEAQAQTELLAVCGICEALLTADLPLALRARTWYDISVVLIHARGRRSLAAAQQAVEAARGLPHGDGGSAPLQLYRALTQLSFAAALMRDETTARSALAEGLRMEQATWPLPILGGGLNARQTVLLMFGDPVEAIRALQQLISLFRRAGRSTANLMGSLVDAQLASGDARAALATGLEFLPQLQGGRDEFDLAIARLNVAAACLALDDPAQARPLLEAGWLQTRVFDQMRAFFADYLALLAALEGRSEAAVLLAGYADASYVAFDDVREQNEAAAVERARSLARAALGEAQFARLGAEGTALSHEQIAAIAFDRRRPADREGVVSPRVV